MENNYPKDDGFICTVYGENDEVVFRSVGPSSYERYEAHLQNKCTWACGWCYDEAMDFLREERNGATTREV